MTFHVRKAFQTTVWVGVVLNWTFVLFALIDPGKLILSLDLGDGASTVWLFNYSVLLALLSCFYIPAAIDPRRYRVNAWLLIAARLIPASTFFVGAATGFLVPGFVKLGSVDSIIGGVELIFLVLLERQSLPLRITPSASRRSDATAVRSTADPPAALASRRPPS
jgi:hypothetical protein